MSETQACPIYEVSQKSPDSICVYGAETNYTYSEVSQLIEAAAIRLQGCGITEGDRVGLLSQNSFEYTVSIFAAGRLGAIIVPLNPRFSMTQWEEQLEIAECKFILAEVQDSDELEHAGCSIAELTTFINDLQPSTTETLGALERPLSIDAAIMFTSGSTGEPKGVVLTRKNFFSLAHASNKKHEFDATKTWLLSLPLCHVGGMAILYRCFTAGASVQLTKWLSTPDLVKALDFGVATHLSIVPAMLEGLLETNSNNPFPSHIERVLIGGATPSRDLIDTIEEKKLPVVNAYGMTEAASTTTATTLKSSASFSEQGCGQALNHMKLRVVDTEGKPSPIGTVGAVELSGDALFRAYITADGEEERTKDWFPTGDTGFIDKKNDLFITGRSDEMFISGGINIYPREIERAAENFEGIRSCAVVAVNHPKWGKRPVLFVEPKDFEAFHIDFFWGHLQGVLPKVKLPDRIVPLQTIPKTAVGKVDYRSLRELAG